MAEPIRAPVNDNASPGQVRATSLPITRGDMLRATAALPGLNQSLAQALRDHALLVDSLDRQIAAAIGKPRR